MREKDSQSRMNLTQLQLYEQFVKKCKSNLHLIIYLSPVGDKLKTRIRNFPSLVSCTSIIWVESWSQTALKSVANYLLPEIDIADACVGIHHIVETMTDSYLRQTGYHYYVTPLSYIQLLNTFQSTYKHYADTIEKQKNIYINGV